MRFEWDDRKNESNLKKHGVDFETASVVFDDPYLVMEQDRVEEGEIRWQTIGQVEDDYLLLVVHLLGADGEHEEVIRIISARDATPKERRRYERGL